MAWREEARLQQQALCARFGASGDEWWSGHPKSQIAELKARLNTLVSDPNSPFRMSGVAGKIGKYFDCPVNISVVWVCAFVKQELENRPVLRARGVDGKQFYFDSSRRVYGSWVEFLRENDLPKCQFCVPLNGRYQEDGSGLLRLEYRDSPSTRWRRCLLVVLDVVFLVLALVGLATGIVAKSLGQRITPDTEEALNYAAISCIASAALYNILRSIHVLYDMIRHI